MLGRFIKRNSLLLTFSAICLLLCGLVLLELDKQYYQNEKRQLIQEYRAYFIDQTMGPSAKENLLRLATEDLMLKTPEAQNKLRAQIWNILKSPSIIYRIKIRVSDEPVKSGAPAPHAEKGPEVFRIDLEAPGKMAELNSFSNSLLMLNFSGTVSLPIENYQGGEIGRLIVYYTTPVKDPAIEELTRLYRWYAAFIVLIMAVLSGAFARALLLPMRNVMNQLESSTTEYTAFVARPRARIEVLYNRMALEAVVARLQGQLREEIARLPQMTGWEVVTFACREFQGQVGAPLVACLELVAEGPGRIRSTGTHIVAGDAAALGDEETLIQWIDEAFPRDGRGAGIVDLPETHGDGEAALKLLSDPERTGIRYLFALGLGERLGESGAAPLKAMLGRLTELVEAGLQTLSFRNQLLVQERGRANISLSRNLGHDLTNIIATSKLELMALERLLGGGQLPTDERRKMILLESLHGLLKSVRFMQETVNLYRAYAFLQHPVLEVHDGNKLISDTLELFSMSISAKIDLREELAEDAPRCLVDPRLIKLALFNLFTNALEAIRKTDPERTARGWIRVLTRRSRDGGLCVAIEDSGTGIMNQAGQRAQAHEIEKIFELGYTTQRISGSHGEGLGLNWVRTIVQDLHGGQIYAENTEDAGARFIILLPVLEGDTAGPVAAARAAASALKAPEAPGFGMDVID